MLKQRGLLIEKVHRLGKVHGNKAHLDPGLGSSGKHDRQQQKQATQPRSFLRTALTDGNCRICKQLEDEGVTRDLFENHLSMNWLSEFYKHEDGQAQRYCYKSQTLFMVLRS